MLFWVGFIFYFMAFGHSINGGSTKFYRIIKDITINVFSAIFPFNIYFMLQLMSSRSSRV